MFSLIKKIQPQFSNIFTKRSISNIGGKSYGLTELLNANFNVPKFFYVESSPNEELNQTQINKQVNTFFPDSVKYFAVRSSASSEDSDKEAKAGQFYTGLGVKRENIFKEAKKVQESFKDEDGTIIIQQFVPSDRAGVMFSNGGMGITAINSNYGLCDTVVKGDVCDEFLLNSEGKVIRETINSKQPQYFDNNQIVDSEETIEHSLSDNDLKILHQKAKEIEDHFGKPQDIEFCFEGDNLYILQSRPVTRNIFHNLEYYDGANIQESFNGIVLPLTYSMASYGFPFAYRQAFANIGVPMSYLCENSDIFDNLLHLYGGRMYYQMNNWHKMTSFIPGNAHKKNFESMITANVTEDTKHDINPISKTKFVFGVIKEYMLLQYRVNSLVRDANKVIEDFYDMYIESKSYEECIGLLRKYHEQFLKKWFLIGENDFCVSAFYGLLKKKFDDTVIADIMNIESASTKQIAAFAKLTNIVKQSHLWEHVIDQDKERFFGELNKDLDTKKAFDDYFKKYGGRFANELKLETLDIVDDFETLSNLMIAYDRTNTENKEVINNDHNIPNMSVFDKIIVNRFRKHAMNREDMRLVRSNFFGVMRSIFTQMGKKMYEAEILDDPRDIFYLNFASIYLHGKLNDFSDTLKDEVEQKKKEYKLYDGIDAPISFAVVNGKFPDLKTSSNNFDMNRSLFNGTGCSPGTIAGRIRVFKDFYVPPKEELDTFDIIVAKNTDPGWTPLIGVCKGMIIENGGILSHASIVSREMNKPTVIGIQNATNILKDGQLVELDGSTGSIKIIK